MKQTLKIGMLAAAAVLMVLTGCKNGLTPTNPSDLSFAMNADDYRAAGEPALFVTNITNEGKFANSATNRIKVSFSMPVTKKSVEAVTIQPLSNPAISGEAPTLGTAITPVKTDVSGKDLYFDVPTEGVKMLYVYVKAAGVKSLGGAVMNQDMDSTSGETKQDDYAEILNSIDGATTFAGSKLYLNMAGESIISYGNLAQISFSSTLTEGKDAGLVNKVTVCFKKANTKLDFNAMYGGVTGEQIGEVLKKHLTFEQFNPETKAFVQVKVTNYAYDSANKEWSAALEGLTSNRTLRAKWVDIKTIKEFETKYPSVVLVFMKHDANLVDTFAPSNSVTSTGGQSALWPVSKALTFDAENEKVTLTLLPVYRDGANFTAVNFKVWADNKYQNVTLKHSEKAYQSFKGFDRDTLKKENFKLLYNQSARKNVSIDKKMIKLEYSDYGYSYDLSVDLSSFAKQFRFPLTTRNTAETIVNDVTFKSSNVAFYPDAVNEVSLYTAPSLSPFTKEELGKISSKFSEWLYGYEFKNAYQADVENQCFTASMNFDINRGAYTGVDLESYKTWLESYRWRYSNYLTNTIQQYVSDQMRDCTNEYSNQSCAIFCEYQVYLSHDVKTAGCTGYYTKDSNEVSVDVPAFSFGEPVVLSDDPYERDGWKKVSVSN